MHFFSWHSYKVNVTDTQAKFVPWQYPPAFICSTQHLWLGRPRHSTAKLIPITLSMCIKSAKSVPPVHRVSGVKDPAGAAATGAACSSLSPGCSDPGLSSTSCQGRICSGLRVPLDVCLSLTTPSPSLPRRKQSQRIKKSGRSPPELDVMKADGLVFTGLFLSDKDLLSTSGLKRKLKILVVL